MSYLVSQIIPAIKTFQIVGNTSKFEAWLDKNHPQKSNLMTNHYDKKRDY